MIDLEDIFRCKVLNHKKLLDYGFIQQESSYVKEIPVMNKQFTIQVMVSYVSKVSYKVIETAFDEEYILVNIPGATGNFVKGVRFACERVLNDIADHCFDMEVFKSKQTKRILDFINSLYGVELEFLWDNSPTSAALRRKDNSKWFAVIMTIDKNKLDFSQNGNVEIMDLKVEPKRVEELLKLDNYYPAYHMNKKHWFTVCLDGCLSDDTLLQLISISYKCASTR